jgi:hypothetical protein
MICQIQALSTRHSGHETLPVFGKTGAPRATREGVPVPAASLRVAGHTDRDFSRSIESALYPRIQSDSVSWSLDWTVSSCPSRAGSRCRLPGCRRSPRRSGTGRAPSPHSAGSARRGKSCWSRSHRGAPGVRRFGVVDRGWRGSTATRDSIPVARQPGATNLITERSTQRHLPIPASAELAGSASA